jgi:hypothetical protein
VDEYMGSWNEMRRRRNSKFKKFLHSDPNLAWLHNKMFFWFMMVITSYMLGCPTLTRFIQMRNCGMWLWTLSCWTRKKELWDYLLLWKTINIELVFYLGG